MSEQATARWMVKRAADMDEVRSLCGFRKTVVAPGESANLSIQRLRIDNSSEHYHTVMEETYYVLNGEGALWLDGQRMAVGPGDAIVIPPGVRHHGEGEIEVLIICAPPFDPDDVYIVD